MSDLSTRSPSPGPLRARSLSEASNDEIPFALEVNQRFENFDEAFIAVTRSSFAQGRATIRSDGRKGQRIWTCAQRDDQGCLFRIYCKADPVAGDCYLRTVINIHDCVNTEIPKRLGIRNGRYVRDLVEKNNDLTTVNAKVLTKTVVNNVQRLVPGIEMTYASANKARNRLLDEALGNHHDSFRQIPSYFDRLRRADPEGLYNLLWEGNVVSQSFSAPSAIRQAFKTCRPYIGLDACFSKTVLGTNPGLYPSAEANERGPLHLPLSSIFSPSSDVGGRGDQNRLIAPKGDFSALGHHGPGFPIWLALVNAST